MRIEEIEKQMTTIGFSEELFSDYIIALKRVRGGFLKCQHCYTTALNLKPKDYVNAIRLIQFGLDNYAESWFERWRSYYNMAKLCENNGFYDKAKQNYQAALDSLEKSQKETYSVPTCAEMLRVEMHLTCFSYSEDLESFYLVSAKETGLAQGFRSRIFYRSLAEMILFDYYKEPEKVATAKQNAFEAIDGAHTTVVDKILMRHKFVNDAHATKEALQFLNKNR